MKSLLTLLMLAPVLLFGQVKKKPVVKAKPVAKTVKTVKPAPLDGFRITATVKGYPDGTSVSLLNGSTGAPESETTINKGKFSFTGKLSSPDFKIILLDKKPPYITLFLDNSDVKINGSKADIENATVTGSQSHLEFQLFNKALEPYAAVYADNAAYDSVAISKAIGITSEFALQHPKSYITPLAIIRFNLVADDITRTEELFNTMDPTIMATPMGNYIAQQIAESKKNAIGTVLPDFSQADTSGKQVSLSSFRGKYVLIDFWASWCGPCRQENPNVVAAFNKYKEKNFTILGVSLDKAKQNWIDAIAMDGLAWTQLSDLQGWGNTVAQQYQIFSIPQNFLIDPQGKVVAKNLRGAALERKLARLLK